MTQTKIVSLEKTHFSIFCHKKEEKRRQDRKTNRQKKRRKKEKTHRQTDKNCFLRKTEFLQFSVTKRGKEKRSVYLEEELLFPKGDKIII